MKKIVALGVVLLVVVFASPAGYADDGRQRVDLEVRVVDAQGNGVNGAALYTSWVGGDGQPHRIEGIPVCFSAQENNPMIPVWFPQAYPSWYRGRPGRANIVVWDRDVEDCQYEVEAHYFKDGVLHIGRGRSRALWWQPEDIFIELENLVLAD